MKIFHHKTLSIFMGIIVILTVILGCILYTSKYVLTTISYRLQTTRLIPSLRILQLSDLHNSEFGTHNSRLISAVRAQSPDLILLTGDLLNSDEQRTDIATELITQLCDIAPVDC